MVFDESYLIDKIIFLRFPCSSHLVQLDLLPPAVHWNLLAVLVPLELDGKVALLAE